MSANIESSSHRVTRSVTSLATPLLAAFALMFAAACADSPTSPRETQAPPTQTPVDTARPTVAVARVQLDASVALDAGSSARIVATPLDADGNALADRTVVWTSSDPLVASVSETGMLTALRAGVVTITATSEGRSAESRVTVRATLAYDLLYDAATTTPLAYPQLFRLDVGTPGAEAERVWREGTSSDVAVSPDGTRIAYVNVYSDRDIWVANRDGSDARRITTTRDNDDQPAWSPDGTRIAFHRWNYIGTPHDVWVVNVDGTGETNLTADLPGEQREPTWSPRAADGSTRIAFTSISRGAEQYLRAQLFTMRDDGTDKRALTPLDDARFDDQAAWSPDGRTILFVRIGGEVMGDLWLVDADGGNARPLMREEEPPFEQRAPTWSPDGSLIAYTSRHEIIGNRSGDWQIYTVRADGTGITRRTSTPHDKFNPAFIAR